MKPATGHRRPARQADRPGNRLRRPPRSCRHEIPYSTRRSNRPSIELARSSRCSASYDRHKLVNLIELCPVHASGRAKAGLPRHRQRAGTAMAGRKVLRGVAAEVDDAVPRRGSIARGFAGNELLTFYAFSQVAVALRCVRATPRCASSLNRKFQRPDRRRRHRSALDLQLGRDSALRSDRRRPDPVPQRSTTFATLRFLMRS